ncbi:gfo/Idh/MocA family oxidoreductase [Actinomyces sp. 2119]|uniref:Gfo/Idh/MocA family oxidoreductase n=1 Tax=Actinomyces lilanjuaniae TaxID=2321394 RepID=A0ABM6Z2G5_9ACTO|nr:MULTISPECIES: Gfo/Idh/MocA family oxidoreductase [Actinomyces]AYD89460.1 gfo/Idh/MocA family oxidoreductase [Actinomyces lilanjuaniae]RJF43183.1 gfo/Idh/MocA family oxidoreductase [Actinomyces sp. 2119]
MVASPAPDLPSADPQQAPVRFGVVGAGFIARWFAEAVAQEPGAQIVAVTSARAERAAAFAREHGVDSSYASLTQMLQAHGPDSTQPVDVIYVGSPNSFHAEHTITALEAGFHVLVEKPFALTVAQAQAMAQAAREADRFLMEAWLSAHEPGVARLRETLPRMGRLRRAVLVKEQRSSRLDAYRAGKNPPAFDPAAGGGSLMDLAVYPVSLAIHLFGTPDRVTATGHLLDSGADSHGTVVLTYDHGESSGLEVVCTHSKTSPAGAGSFIASEQDALVMDDCQWPRRIELRGPAASDLSGEGDRGAARNGSRGAGPQARQDLSVDRHGPALGYELAEVCRLVRSGARGSSLHPVYASIAAVDVLAQARAQVGVRFPADECGQPR